jgi:hypothetical protein
MTIAAPPSTPSVSATIGPLRSVALGLVCLAGLAAPSGCSSTSSPTPAGGHGDDTGPTSQGLGFSPSNGLAAALDTVDWSSLPDIDVTKSDEQASVDCDGNAQCVALTATQTDGSMVQVYVANSWKVEPAGVLNIVDKMPVILVAFDTITVLGRIDASATSNTTVAGGFAGSAAGPGVGGTGMESSMGSYGTGAGGASYCGLGGAGGQATSANGGAGKTYGSPTLIPLMGGSAGGVGDLFSGAGGGAIQLVAGTSITVGASGIVSVGGGGGYDGSGAGQYAASAGGSGGALLFEAPAVTIAGLLEANGGGGGGGLDGPSIASDATPNSTPASGGAPGTTGVGGAGSAGGTTSGGAGAAGDPATGPGENGPGAGGGGAGYIRINTSSASATITGTLSPAVGTTCVSQGTIAH